MVPASVAMLVVHRVHGDEVDNFEEDTQIRAQRGQVGGVLIEQQQLLPPKKIS